MDQRRALLRRGLVTAACLLGMYLVIVVMLAYQYVHPVRRRSALPARFREEIMRTDRGDTPLTYSPAAPRDSARTVFLFVHGYGGNREHWHSLMTALHRRGHDSVAVAMPGQDASGIAAVGFGSTESEIIMQAAETVRNAYPPGIKLVVVGVSLGGASSWIAAGRRPELFDAVVTESAYANLDQTSRRYVALKLPSAAFVLEPIVVLGQRIAGITPSQWHPIDYAARYRGGPRVLIHCENDELVTRDVTDQLARAAAAEVYVAKQTAHARWIESDLPDYVKQLDRVAKRLTPPDSARGPQSPRSQTEASGTSLPPRVESTR